MRLFFAIALDDAVRAAAAQVIDGLQHQLAAAGSARAIKWVERENLHVTMRFLGEIEEGTAKKLIDGFSEPLAESSFDLTVGGAGAFPPAGAPRVLWIGAQAGRESARTIHEAIEARLSRLGFDREARAYTPHATLGRVREIDRRTGTNLREWLANVPPVLAIERVTGVTLYRSHLSSSGPRYERVIEVPLS